MKISFIGAGGVACSTAFALTFKDLFNEMVLLDINLDYAKGKAMDLEQSAIINHKNISVIGTNDYKYTEGSDAIVITAGSAKTGGNREALLEINKKIITEVSNSLKPYIKNDDTQPLIIIVTNPLDSILKFFIEVGDYNPKKTIGSGNWLDTGRFKYYLSKELEVSSDKIETFVVGQHGKEMVYLLSQTKIDGQPLFNYMKEHNVSMEKIESICKASTLGATEIIDLIQQGGTYYGPANSIVELITAYFNNTQSLVTASVLCNGEYGVDGNCLGVPVVLGSDGVEEVKVFNLTNDEKEKLKKAYNFVKELNEK